MGPCRGTRASLTSILQGADMRASDLRGPINVLYHSRSYVPLKVRAFIDFYAARAALHFAAAAPAA